MTPEEIRSTIKSTLETERMQKAAADKIQEEKVAARRRRADVGEAAWEKAKPMVEKAVEQINTENRGLDLTMALMKVSTTSKEERFGVSYINARGEPRFFSKDCPVEVYTDGDGVLHFRPQNNTPPRSYAVDTLTEEQVAKGVSLFMEVAFRKPA